MLPHSVINSLQEGIKFFTSITIASQLPDINRLQSFHSPLGNKLCITFKSYIYIYIYITSSELYTQLLYMN